MTPSGRDPGPGSAMTTMLPECRASRLARLGRLAVEHPWATLAAAGALHTVPTLGARELWFADEVRHGHVLQELLQGGHWVVLYLNGAPYPDKPPLYFWFLGLLASLVRSDRPWVFFLGAALSALALLAATVALARAVGGLDRRGALPAALLPLASLFLAVAAHYTRPDLLFAALITLAHVCLYRAWTAPAGGALSAAPPGAWALAGFALAGVATLVKGPLGLVLPLVTALGYLGWRRELRRLVAPTVLAALASGLALPAAWLAAAWVLEGEAFVTSLLVRQVYRRATASFMHAQPPYYYLLALPLVWLPWTLVLLGRPWRGGARPGAGDPPGGITYLWCAAISGLVVLSALSIKLEVYLLPLIPPLAVLTWRALAGMAVDGRRVVWIGVAAVLLATGVVVAALPGLVPSYAVGTRAGASGAILAALGGVVLSMRGARPAPVLAVLVVGFGVWINATVWLAAPALDAIMSPRPQAEVMGRYARQGYVAVAHNTFPGIYPYYAGGPVRETRRLEALADVLSAHDRVVVAMRSADWDRWPSRPADLRIVHRQRIADTDTVLAVRGP
jgi:4-amino-4-deoxy-L-arabinose transferase-like glycosyltransferase